MYERDITKRRYSKVRLYTGGRILHIVRYKPESSENERYLFHILSIIYFQIYKNSYNISYLFINLVQN